LSELPTIHIQHSIVPNWLRPFTQNYEIHIYLDTIELVSFLYQAFRETNLLQ